MAPRPRLKVRPAAPKAPRPKVPESFLRSPIFAAERQDTMKQAGIGPAELRAYLTPEGVPPDALATKHLQSLLNSQGGYKLAVDGVYGPQTEGAYKEFTAKRAETQLAQTTAQYDRYAQLSNERNKKLTQQAEAARAELLKIADEIRSNKELRETSRQLKAIASDRARFSNETVVYQLRELKAAQKKAAAQAKAQQKEPSLVQKVFKLGFSKNPILRGALKAISIPQEEIAQAYYSGKRAQLRGAGVPTQARATAAGLPGLGFLAGKGTRRDVEAVNSYQERAALTAKGELASAGEFFSGRAQDKLSPAALARANKAGLNFKAPSPVRGALSAGTDLGFQVFTDPLNAAFSGVQALGRVGSVAGEAGLRAAAQQAGRTGLGSTRRLAKTLGADAVTAQQAGRIKYIMESKTGKALLDQATEAVARNQDIRSLRKAIRGLPTAVADEALKTARTQGINAARGKLARAFVEGTWNPTVKLRTQGRLGLGIDAAVGKGAVRTKASPTERIRDYVRGTEPTAGLITGNPQAKLAFALESSLRQVGEYAPDFYKASVAPKVSGLGIQRRLTRVERLANDIDLGEFSEVVDSELNRLADLHMQTRQRLPVGERKPLVQAVEAGLRRVEALAEVLQGEAGQRSLRQATAGIEGTTARRAGLGLNPLKRAGQVALSIAEPMAPPSVRLAGAKNPVVAMNNRVESIDRWAAALGADSNTMAAMRRAAEEATTERQLYRIIHDALVRVAESAGVEPKRLIAELEARVREGMGKRGFTLDENGDLVREVQTAAQLVEDIPLLAPEEVARVLRTLRAEGGNRAAKVRVGLGNSFPRTRALLEKGHKAWKFNIVTNAYAPFIGAGAGFAQGDTLEERLKGAAVGAAIGALGPVRYILRVAGTEERLRFFFDQGFAPKKWVPYLSKHARTAGLDRPFMSHDIIRAGNEFGNHLSNRALVSVDSSWVALTRKEPRYVDGWWRIVNHQIHPESDRLMQIMLEEKAGLLTKARAGRAANKFLASPDGQLLLKRLKGGLGGPKSVDDAIARYRTFVDDYVPADVAAARLDGEVDRAVLKAQVKSGVAPETIHAQKTWVLPKSIGDVFAKVNQLTGKVVLEGPTTRMNRIPLAEWIYHDEYQRLIRNGLDPDRAQSMADEFAAERTNSIMFQINDESRFAKKVDFVFPFQQPREELLRVWGKLLAKNPGRTFRTVRLAALGFNHGSEMGVFRKDEFTGQWEMTVPGSAYISNRLFGVNVGFDANLRDFLFFGQGAYGLNTIPSFGGPYWQALSRSFINSNPEFYENMNPHLRTLLFPYGSSGKLVRNEFDRLWMAFAGSAPPWEFFAKFEQENEIKRWQVEMYNQLRYQHFKETGDPDWEPSEDEVIQATKEFFKVWAFIGSTFPAAPHPVFPSQEAFNKAKILYTNQITGKLDYERFTEDHPQFIPFLSKRTKYVGPDDYKHWTRTQEEKANDTILHYKTRLSLSEFRDSLKEAREISAAYRERDQHFNIPVPAEREAALQQWRAKYPELAQRTRTVLHRDTELNHILNSYPQSQQPAALDRWRKEYDVDFGQYKRLKEKVKTARYSPWRLARDTEDIVKDVAAARRAGIDQVSYVSGLAPAEQVRWWQSRIADMDYMDTKNPQAVLDEYNNAKRQIGAIFKGNPQLRSLRPKTDWEKALSGWRGDVAKQINASYQEVDLVRAAMDKAAQGKDWKTYYALKDKRTALYDQIKALKNKQYQQMPELAEFETEVSALLYFQKPGAKGAFVGDGNVEFLPSNEESRFLSMPDPVQQAYIDDLLKSLDTPEGQKGKLFYEWLTDFQKDLLDSNLPEEQVRGYKIQRPLTDEERQAAKGGSGNFIGALFAEYNKRPKGAKPPAGYQEYLALPKNPAVRSQYLKAHPAVAAWIKAGPMANMPEVLRQVVANLMIKNGKWDGELKTWEEVADLSFAREQLKRFSQREGATKPDTYDLWVNMPSGVEKAIYLKEHPEVQDWIRKGPMSNMPEEYRDVVRDIMTRYGEWTSRQDPLGDTINGYYKVPSFARKAYLEQHPELVAYWAALRSPEENAVHALADQYYAMPEPGARRLFLAAHPELQQFFMEARRKRYEKFLNKVAQFMGQNPALFKEYLDRQEDILAEMLRRFAEPNLVREVPKLTQQSDKTGNTRGKRRRAA